MLLSVAREPSELEHGAQAEDRRIPQQFPGIGTQWVGRTATGTEEELKIGLQGPARTVPDGCRFEMHCAGAGSGGIFWMVVSARGS